MLPFRASLPEKLSGKTAATAPIHWGVAKKVHEKGMKINTGLFFDGFFDLYHKVGRNRINFMNAFCMFSDLFQQLDISRCSRLEFTVHPDIFAGK
jgi:hypothetical protein